MREQAGCPASRARKHLAISRLNAERSSRSGRICPSRDGKNDKKQRGSGLGTGPSDRPPVAPGMAALRRQGTVLAAGHRAAWRVDDRGIEPGVARAAALDRAGESRRVPQERPTEPGYVGRPEELALEPALPLTRDQLGETVDDVGGGALAGLRAGQLSGSDQVHRPAVAGLELPGEVAGAVERDDARAERLPGPTGHRQAAGMSRFLGHAVDVRVGVAARLKDRKSVV